MTGTPAETPQTVPGGDGFDLSALLARETARAPGAAPLTLPRVPYGLGIDPAARNDYFATAVLHPSTHPDADGCVWRVDRLDRIRGVELNEMHLLAAFILTQLDQQLPEQAAIGCAMDATGIGAGPAAQLYQWLPQGHDPAPLSRPVAYRAVQITAGDTENKVKRSAYLVNISRAAAITDLVMIARLGLLDTQTLTDDEKDALGEELKTFVRKELPSGKERLEHDSGGHDDLLFALALGVWIARRMAGSVGAIWSPTAALSKTAVGAPRGAVAPVRGRASTSGGGLLHKTVRASPRGPATQGGAGL